MPSYDPPNAHYAHVDIPDHDADSVFAFVGKNGWRFKKLTRDLGVQYIYYHHDAKRITVHGSYRSMLNMPCQKIVDQLDEFVEHKKTCTDEPEDYDMPIVKEDSDGDSSSPPPPSPGVPSITGRIARMFRF